MRLLNQIASGNVEAQQSQPPTQEKLKHTAHEFEASLMQELMVPLQKNSLSEPAEGDDTDSGSSAALAGFAAQSMAQALSKQGGFGIAKMILDHFHACER